MFLQQQVIHGKDEVTFLHIVKMDCLSDKGAAERRLAATQKSWCYNEHEGKGGVGPVFKHLNMNNFCVFQNFLYKPQRWNWKAP